MASQLDPFAPWILSSGLVLISLYCLFKGLLTRAIGRAIGNHLKSRTQDRRETLLEQARQENKKQPSFLPHQQRKSEDLDWEKVEGRVVEQADEQEQKQKHEITPDVTWNGLIGFFHPFWYTHFSS